MKHIQKKLLAILLVIFQIISIIPNTSVVLAEGTREIEIAAQYEDGPLTLENTYYIVVGDLNTNRWYTPEKGALNPNLESGETYRVNIADDITNPWICLKPANTSEEAKDSSSEGEPVVIYYYGRVT